VGTAEQVRDEAATKPPPQSPRPDAAASWIGLAPAISLASVLLFLAVWWGTTEFGWVAPVFLPSPRAVLVEAGKLVGNGELWTAVLASSKRVFLGFALAAGLLNGFLVGFVQLNAIIATIGTNALLYPRLGDYAIVKPATTEVVRAGLFDDHWQVAE